jgi:hypothetical protein
MVDYIENQDLLISITITIARPRMSGSILTEIILDQENVVSGSFGIDFVKISERTRNS